jgi:putative NIF3 family GTP cyclohydrolase 1 type 2
MRRVDAPCAIRVSGLKRGVVDGERSELDSANMKHELTRRGFVQTLGASAATAAFGQPAITANEVVGRIKKKLELEGVLWGPSAFDGFHLGDPGTVVTGIATTFQPTLNVLQRAAAANRNFVVCHESTYWDGFDPVESLRSDPVCQAKIRFGEQHKMIVWRIHDHWHRRKPDPIFLGLAKKLGWEKYYDSENRPRHYTIPEASLEDVAIHIQRSLGTKNVVVVGDRNLRVKAIGDCAHVLGSVLPSLRLYDVALVGETPQHDTFEYVRDAIALGQKKAVVMISHQALEEWGMETCAGWLKPLVPEVPVQWIASGDPFLVPNLPA